MRIVVIFFNWWTKWSPFYDLRETFLIVQLSFNKNEAFIRGFLEKKPFLAEIKTNVSLPLNIRFAPKKNQPNVVKVDSSHFQPELTSGCYSGLLNFSQAIVQHSKPWGLSLLSTPGVIAQTWSPSHASTRATTAIRKYAKSSERILEIVPGAMQSKSKSRSMKERR